MLFVDEAISSRRSVREFSAKSVKNKDVVDIIEAGCAAPSAKNRQPWSFIVLDKATALKMASEMKEWAAENKSEKGTVQASAEIIEKAPIVIAVCTPSKKKWASSDYISLGACLENMSLKAVDLGLGSLIVCDIFCVEEKCRRYADTKEEISALFLIGYPYRNANGTKRKPLQEKVRGISIEFSEGRQTDLLPEAHIEERRFAFISYAHADADIVLNDIVEFKKHGIVLWYDRSIAHGEKWDDKALGVIAQDNCAVVFLYLSDSSARSSAVARER